jgi:site-specific DNA-cytosine methylase
MIGGPKGPMNEEEKPTHLDLFSGIGGFAIAAQEAGFQTVAFCEADERCRAFLERRWGRKVHPDVRTLDGKLYRGVSLLTGGPPCQPASRAGKQGGAGDDRWLWPEALRVLEEALPDCVVFENPPGIGDVGLDGILSKMGGLGYEVQVFDIPACAVDSPQLRHRLWIVGFLADSRRQHGGRRPHFKDPFPAGAEAVRIPAAGDAERGGVSDLADPEGGGQRANGSAPRSRGHADERGEGGVLDDSDGDRREAGERGPEAARQGPTAEPAARLGVADAGRERRREDEQERGPEGRAPARRDREDELADPPGPGREGADAEPGAPGLRPEPRPHLADAAGPPGPEQLGEPRELTRRETPPADSAEPERPDKDLADAGLPGAPRQRGERGPGSGEEGGLRGGAEGPREPAGGGQPVAHAAEQHGPGERETRERGRSAWGDFVWVPCADGKIRRAPDDSVSLVDGLHRSLLAALGNSISPQVATPILRACRRLIDL